jgi:hypothetical protein
MEQCPWLNKDLKQMVTAPDGTHVVPVVILKLSGDVNMEKRRIASALLLGFLSSKTPKKEHLSGSSTSPSVMTYCHTILGLSKDLVDWCFQLNRDFNFAGGLTSNLNKLFENHAKMHGSLYGSGAGHQILKNVRTSKDLLIDTLDKNDPKEHQMKEGTILGAFFGFCGGTEHANLLVEHLEVGLFEVGHEC